MLIPWSWLREWVPTDLSPEEVGHRLAFRGLGLEAIETSGGFENIVVGRIESIEPHPNADRLVVCRVDTGEAEPRQIVCGATNMSAGDFVPVALPGAVLGDTKIKKSKLRGVKSEGMMCSARELGLGDDHAGLLLLDNAPAVGTPADAVLQSGDTILELEITANRGDCLSIRGVAREVALAAEIALQEPIIALTETGPEIESLTSVTLDDPKGCPRYACRVIQNIAVGPSPDWLAARVTQCGMRPINNVVDATNYVMFELGQPLHAFDMQRLQEHRIIVRRAQDSERMLTLDGEERTLDASMTVIADAARIVAVAGVMGAEDSGVTEATTDVLLESAYFDPDSIRRTRRELKLSTESSYRFERGVDPNAVPMALDRLTQLILETAGGTLATGRIDAYPNPITPPTVMLRIPRIETVLGLTVSDADTRHHLESLGCTVAGGGEQLEVTVPSWRSDLLREIDLIEEIARLVGYDAIPATLPTGVGHGEATPTAEDPFEDRLRELLVGAGYTEIATHAFVSGMDLQRVGLNDGDPTSRGVQIVNPLSEDRAILRPALLPSLLKVAGANQRMGHSDLQLFEIGTVFHPAPSASDSRPREEQILGAVLAGGSRDGGWWGQDRELSIYDAKGAAEFLFDALGITDVVWTESDRPYLRPGVQIEARIRKHAVAWVGEVAPEVVVNFEARPSIFAWLVNVEALESHLPGRVGYTAFSRFPPRLWARTYDVPEATKAGEVYDILVQTGGALLEEARLTDIYRGDTVGEGMKSLTYSLTFRAPDRTLEDRDVEPIINKIDKTLGKRCQATVRDA